MPLVKTIDPFVPGEKVKGILNPYYMIRQFKHQIHKRALPFGKKR